MKTAPQGGFHISCGDEEANFFASVRELKAGACREEVSLAGSKTNAPERQR